MKRHIESKRYRQALDQYWAVLNVDEDDPALEALWMEVVRQARITDRLESAADRRTRGEAQAFYESYEWRKARYQALLRDGVE